ncbi:YgeY family selenium metabolism-linked hydrolase [Anaerolineales bacterium HSG25]|nr:YgeY family selenium metabolism-linked hydrolase [Anaerolineales bacterium HSG25]
MSTNNTAHYVEQIQQRVAEHQEDLIQFLKELCAIPSMDNQIGPVGERIQAEMIKLGYDEVRFDKMGNTLGRIGNGPKVLLYDTHIDTVGIGDPDSWDWDPFTGKTEDGVFYARGAGDEKCSTPGMVYGLAIARDLGLLDGYTVYCFGNMEEWCDGISGNSFVEADPKVKPDYVVIGESTKMQVYRGHKGRLELKVVAKGTSAHAASNHLGDNAIYKMLPIIEAISNMEPELGDHAFLGHGKITVSDIQTSNVSINAVPDECTIFIDRRMTFGETKEGIIAKIESLIPEDQKEFITVEMLFYDEPSYTGFVFPVDKYFPAWALEDEHAFVQAGQATRKAIGLADAPTSRWEFSTNATYWAGKAGIPCIGFGPGDESVAHTVLDSVPLDEMVKSTEFYALLPWILALK